MIKDVLLAFSTLSLIYTIAISLLQFLEISKKDFGPVLTDTMEPINSDFGVALTSLVIAFLCFHLIINRYVPIGIESFFPIEKSMWSKFIYSSFLGLMVFFYAGLYGVIACFLVFISSLLNLILDMRAPRKEHEDIIELENI